MVACRRHWQHAQNLATVALFEAGERRAEGEACEQLGDRLAAVKVWRDTVEDLLEVGADAAHATIELQIARGDLLAVWSGGEFGGGALGVAPEGDSGAVRWVRREVARLGLHELHLALQAEVAGDARSETTNGVREHWGANAVDIASECHAAEFGARLNQNGFDASTRQVGGGYKAVMSATNHHHVSGGGRLCGARHLLHLWRELGLGWRLAGLSIVTFGKLNLSCDVIVVNHFSHQVIVFE